MLIADDLGWRDVGWHKSEIETPHLDALAAAGVRLERFYVEPNCTPTRAAFTTGRYPSRYGLQSVLIRPWTDVGLPLEERTLAEVLRDAGYTTHLVGKWHLGHGSRAQLPTARGYDHHYGCYTGAIDYYTHRRAGALDWHRDGVPVEEEGYATDLLADEAVRIVQEHVFDGQEHDFDGRGHDSGPLFLQVAFTAPHTPLQAPDEYVARYADQPMESRRILSAMVTCMDDGVGRIVAALDERGVRDETLILFFSDNGGSRIDGSDNGRLLGAKGMITEGGVRVPAVAAWRGRIQAGGIVKAPLHAIDLFPTLAGFAGAPLPPDLALDGLDVGATLLGGPPPARRDLLLTCTKLEAVLLDGDWKLVVKERFGRVETNLFDLSRKKPEEHDLSAERPDLVRALRARLERYEKGAEPREMVPQELPADFPLPRAWGPR